MKSPITFSRQILQLSLLCIALCSSLVVAQESTGVLQGKITTANGEPVVNANVFIKELVRGDASSELGVYTIRNLPPGSYTVVVSSIGYETVSRTITVEPGKILNENFVLHDQPIELPAVVITGTRSEKTITDVPIPTSVITNEQIAAQSATRLNDVLAEQPGMFISYNQWGTGIQVEGLDPAYTLILLDGEPIIGRTAGTLELTRLSLGNIQRVEVVKGPSSSLYGSDALAAVVNLISKQPSKPLMFSLNTKYGSHNTFDLSSGVEVQRGAIGASVFIDRNSSDGYDLSPETVSQTTPRYANYSVSPKLFIDLGEYTTASISGRLVTQDFSNVASVLDGAATIDVDDHSTLLDWSVNSALIHQFSPETRLETRLYRADYKTESKLTRQTDASMFDESSFKQTYNKGEAQLNTTLSQTLFSTLGSGYVYETVLANRISGDEHANASFFAFVQQEWIPSASIDLIASFRYDAHQEYASRLSPKVSALVKPFDWLSIRASIGSGFKAPTFQQLYLDFTNPQVGYTVFGSATVKDAFQRLEQSGQVESILLNPNQLETIQPENSFAYNAGVDIHLSEQLSFKANGFRNDLRDLIEAAPFAMRTNGQAVFTYFNIHRVFTQGFDAEVMYKPYPSLTLSAAYQYLEAKDQDVLNDVRAGKIFKIGSTGRARPVQEAEYGGLFNRSAHSGTFKVSYEHHESGFAAHLRGILRSRVGFADINGNTILDDDSEYAPGYTVWNMTVSQAVSRDITVQAGVENLFDTTHPAFFPSLPGRILYARFSYEYH